MKNQKTINKLYFSPFVILICSKTETKVTRPDKDMQKGKKRRYIKYPKYHVAVHRVQIFVYIQDDSKIFLRNKSGDFTYQTNNIYYES